MIKKICFFLLGITLIGFVIFLGFKSVENSYYVVWFGLACALVAPVGLSCISKILNSRNNMMLQQLFKVSQIEAMVQEAQTQEEKIKQLEMQLKSISATVKNETLKHAALERRAHLLHEAEHILHELEKVDIEMQRIVISSDEERQSNQIIDQLYQRLDVEGNNQRAVTLLSILYEYSSVGSLALNLYFYFYDQIKKVKRNRKKEQDS